MSNSIRNPRRSVRICIALSVLGTAAMIWGIWRMNSQGFETAATAISIAVGGLVALFGVLLAINFSWAARIMADMQAGRNLIAQWTVPPQLFDRFREADRALRETEGYNDYGVPKRTAAEGVEVLVSRDAVMVGDIWFGLSKVGIARFDGVTYRPQDPPMLVFDTVLTQAYSGTTFSTRNMRGVLRVPVAVDAADQAGIVLNHYRDVLAGRVRGKPGFYRRRIKLGLGAAVVGLIVFGLGFALREVPGLDSNIPPGVAITGAMVGLGGLVLAVLAWMMDQKEGSGP